MLYFTAIGLLCSAFFAICFPSYIQDMAMYKDQSVLIVDWGIYALMLGLILLLESKHMYTIIGVGLSISFMYNMYMFQNKQINPDGKFLIIANILNALALMEIIYKLYV